MNTRKFLQLFVLLSVLLASFASTSSAFAAPASAGQCGTSVTVVSGDTLRKIADRCGTSVAALRLANPEIGWGNLIYPGQLLLLPGAILYGDNGYDTYVVSRGDTLKSLANRFGTSVDTLLSLNGSITNVNLIYEVSVWLCPPGVAYRPHLRRPTRLLRMDSSTMPKAVTRCARSLQGSIPA